MRRALGLLVVFFLLAMLLAARPAPAAKTPEPLATVDTGEGIPVTAAWSPDGTHLAYGTEKRRPLPSLSAGEEAYYYPGEVYVTDFSSKPKRIVKDDLIRERDGRPLTYHVDAIDWSPDGQKLAVEIHDAHKRAAVFFYTSTGKRLKVGDSDKMNFIPGYGAAWLGDSATVGVASEAMSPRLLERVSLLRVEAGRRVPVFGNRTFAAVAWMPRAFKAALVERDSEFAQPPKLVIGNLNSGSLDSLGEIPDFMGGLAVTPDEATVSYFVGQEKLAVRGLAPDAPVEIWPIVFGRYQWVESGKSLLYLEPKELGARTGWLTLYRADGQQKTRLLPQQPIQDFWVAPDGKRVAVLTEGLMPRLEVYALDAGMP